MTRMQVHKTIAAIRQQRNGLSGVVGLVPTMGYLHAGHLALVDAARASCAHVIVSIFVNPMQFGAGDDLSTYPRDLQRDLDLLQAHGADLVFTPEASEIYPHGFQTTIVPGRVASGKEGAQRDGHFSGVATVVAKLFNITRPQQVFFGQKDAQQVAVIRRMVHDLNFDLTVNVVPIVREDDGLALSSRNTYLQGEDRRRAITLRQALDAIARTYDAGEREAAALRHAGMAVFDAAGITPDYISVADAASLEEQPGRSERPLLVSLAARVGRPRLLDNMLLPADLNTREGATQVLGNPHGEADSDGV